MDNGQDLVPNLFVKYTGEPLSFHLHSMRQHYHRSNLVKHIEKYGGVINPTDTGSDVILVHDDNEHGLDVIRNAYKGHSDLKLMTVRVESTEWPFDCIRNKRVDKIIFEQKRMGGALGVLPHKADGGRLGNKIYVEMVKSAQDGVIVGNKNEYSWVNNHPASSWRQHYKKNQARLDKMITAKVKEINRARHQGYELSRNALPSRRSGRYTAITKEEEESTDDSIEIVSHDLDISPRSSSVFRYDDLFGWEEIGDEEEEQEDQYE
ncbi:hypothetical protein C8R43DRAFT_1148630 [Mycena crocata]|nr:hypothetical protein C8R43DRAFT_1148630 [Mycena crocata]